MRIPKLADGDAGDDGKAKVSDCATLPNGGIRQVLRQRLRTTNATRGLEYCCVWVGREQADATWETEASLKKVINGLEMLVSVATCL